jgi:hypothetical protein
VLRSGAGLRSAAGAEPSIAGFDAEPLGAQGVSSSGPVRLIRGCPMRPEDLNEQPFFRADE